MKEISTLNALLLLLLISLVVLFAGLGRAELRGSTEPREAGVAAEMLQEGDYLTPKLNGESFLEKPPLSYWLQAASIRAFGYTNFAPRLPSVIASIVSIFSLFFFARLNRSTTTGVVAGLLLLTMASFWMNSRQAGQDSLLTLGITLSLLSFYLARESKHSRLYWLGYGIGLSVATLTKGVIGLAIPGVAIFFYLLIETFFFDKRFVYRNWLLPAVFAMVALVPIVVWLYLLYLQHGVEAVREVVWTNSVGRFAGDYTRGSHSEPFYYYLKKLPETFQPWTLPLFVALWQMGKSWRGNRQFVFFACWLIVPFILLSLSAGKRPVYLLSLYPAAAMLITAYVCEGGYTANDRTGHRLGLIQAICFTGIAIAIVVRIGKIHLPVVGTLLAVILVAALIYVWRSALHDRRGIFFGAAVATMTAAYVGYGGFILPHDAVKESARQIFDHLRTDANRDTVILFNPTERISGAARFYAQKPVQSVDSEAKLEAAWDKQSAALVLISATDAVKISNFVVREKFHYGKELYLIVARASPGS